MKTKILLSILALGLFFGAQSQNTIELTFTAIDSAAYVQLDSIKVMNRTQGGDTVLYYPDTVLVWDYTVGINQTSKLDGGLIVSQNYPNPVIGQTTITLQVPSPDMVKITISDLMGRQIINSEQNLERGLHSFKLTPGSDRIYFFNALWKNENRTIKILNIPSGLNRKITLEYLGTNDPDGELKAKAEVKGLGDELLLIGYYDTLQSGILDSPKVSKTYTFQFAYNIPCLGTPTIGYEGQVYNTIQIFNQCWLKENLNVGTMVNGEAEIENNRIINKRCYNNDTNNCNIYGGLYTWYQAMNWSDEEGTKGICPLGWHLPTDEEWKVLLGATDSQYGIGDPEWDLISHFAGFNAGTTLKATSYWDSGGNGTDLYGFSGLPSGGGNTEGHFYRIGEIGFWWTSRGWNYAESLIRDFQFDTPKAHRALLPNNKALSVRCIRD